MCRVYCDTCVYIDLFEGRKDRFRDLGEFALNLFRQVRDKKYKLVVSDWVIEEFMKQKDKKIIEEFLDEFKDDNLIRIMKDKEDERKARELSKTNYPDALHVVLAKKANAIYLVTRNIQDFAEFQNMIDIIMPETL